MRRQQYLLSCSSFKASLMILQFGSDVLLVGAVAFLLFDNVAVVVPQMGDDFVASEAANRNNHLLIYNNEPS